MKEEKIKRYLEKAYPSFISEVLLSLSILALFIAVTLGFDNMTPSIKAMIILITVLSSVFISSFYCKIQRNTIEAQAAMLDIVLFKNK